MGHDHWLDGFMPHGHCYLWDPNLLLLHSLSDSLIGAAYFGIAFVLVIFMRRRKDLPFPWLFAFFSAVFATCGMTHLLEVYNIYVPAYWLSGGIKAVTALISVVAVIWLLKLVPEALALPSPAELQVTNEKLRASNNALHESEERYSRLVSDVKEYSIIALDTAGNVETWNAGAQRINGYRAEEIMGRHFSCFYTPEQLEEGVPAKELKMAEEEGRFETEAERVRKDGSRFAASLVITALRDEKGRLRGFSTITRDITQRKQAEQAVRDAHTRAVTELVESISDGFVIIDREWRLVRVNSAASKLLRKPPQELLGQLVWDVFPKTERLLFEKEYRRAMAGKEAVKFEEHYPEPINTWFEVRAYPSSDGLNIFLTDISERKQAEEALLRQAELLDIAHDAILVREIDGTISFWNHGAEEMYGYSKEQAVGRKAQELLQTVFPGSFAEFLERLLCDGRWEGELIHTASNGARIVVASRWVLQLNMDGFPLGMLEINNDITEVKRAAEEAQRAKEAAEAANRAKDQFLAVLSHELRTPLTPALMIITAHEAGAPLTPEDVAMVRRNLEMEARLIDDLLDMNRLAYGKIALHSTPLDLHHVLQNIVAICKQEIDAKGVALHLELTSSQHNVNGDDGRLQQVFWNLLKNATKFTPVGGSITIRSSNPREGIVRVELADTGVGINPHNIPQLFVAFEQGGLRAGHQFGGLGLGLAISKAVVDLHGGQIRAESAGEGKGATFVVELPTTKARVAGEMENGAESAPSLTKVQPNTEDRNLRILLVEDNADTLLILSRLLEKAGYYVTTATDVSSALAAAKVARAEQRKFDLVVSDLGLPDGNGRDLMRQLHELDGLVGIAISGYGMEDDIEKSVAAGFSEHLTKPIQLGELQQAISRLTAKSI